MPGGGSRKGERRGGRKPGTKNKATIERERAAMLATGRETLLLEARAAAQRNEAATAVASGPKLMKELGFELTQIFAEMALYYRPLLDRTNPKADQRKFKEYAILAMQGARDFAAYESPKFATVMTQSAVVTKIEVVGGLPDELDGSLQQSLPSLVVEPKQPEEILQAAAEEP